MQAEGGQMPTKAQVLMLAALAALAMGPVAAQSRKTAAAPSAKDSTVSSGGAKPETLKTLRAVAEALGMIRFSDIGSGNTHLPAVDAVTTMEIWGSGTTVSSGQPYKTDYHAAIDYSPA